MNSATALAGRRRLGRQAATSGGPIVVGPKAAYGSPATSLANPNGHRLGIPSAVTQRLGRHCPIFEYWGRPEFRHLSPDYHVVLCL
jgi:hypothetical protein